MYRYDRTFQNCSVLIKIFIVKEQPLLLEDLLEQEKREQEKLQNQTPAQEVTSSTAVESESALLSDHDFERLKADVFNSGPVSINTPVSQGSYHGLSCTHFLSNGFL